MAKFEKGHKKLGGRKAGTPNKTSRIVKEKFLEELCEYVETGLFHQDIATIDDPAKRLDLVVKIANYILPKQSSVDSTVSVSSETQQSFFDRLNQLAMDNE